MSGLIIENLGVRWWAKLGELLRHYLRRHVKGAAIAVFLIAASKTAIKVHILARSLAH